MLEPSKEVVQDSEKAHAEFISEEASIPSPIFPIGCDYVQAALLRVGELRGASSLPLESPTVSEMEEALGERVQRFELWQSNWRNRVYRAELAGGATAVAKQLIVGTEARFQGEVDQLGRLSRLQIPGLRVPKVLAVLPAKHTYVMEMARGQTISALLRKNKDKVVTLKACELAGKVLAGIHRAWTQEIGPMPVDVLARDMDATLWHLSSQQRKILQTTFEVLAGAEVRLGRVYYDYKPSNLFFDDGELSLIDPPAISRRGVQLWDVSVFLRSMQQESWKLRFLRPLARRGGINKQSVAAFERGYLGSFTELHPEPALFPLAARLLDLQRTAVWITMQKGKVATVRKSGDEDLRNSLANRAMLSLLEMEKRWLFRELARGVGMTKSQSSPTVHESSCVTNFCNPCDFMGGAFHPSDPLSAITSLETVRPVSDPK